MLKLPSINNVFRNKSTSLGSIRYKISDYQIQVSANQILSLSAIFDNSCILSCRLLCRISVIVHIKWSVSVDDSHHKVLESCMTETNLFLMVSWTQGLEFSMFFKAASSLRLYYRTEAMEKGHAKFALKGRCTKNLIVEEMGFSPHPWSLITGSWYLRSRYSHCTVFFQLGILSSDIWMLAGGWNTNYLCLQINLIKNWCGIVLWRITDYLDFHSNGWHWNVFGGWVWWMVHFSDNWVVISSSLLTRSMSSI